MRICHICTQIIAACVLANVALDCGRCDWQPTEEQLRKLAEQQDDAPSERFVSSIERHTANEVKQGQWFQKEVFDAFVRARAADGVVDSDLSSSSSSSSFESDDESSNGDVSDADDA